MPSLDIGAITKLREKVIDYLKKKEFDNVVVIKNEEQTKNWLILPFFSALGFDTQSTDVVPEEITTFGDKSEKVDYVLQVDDIPVALAECKKFCERLDIHVGQLQRYFNSTDVHLGILTNGVEYWFFTDEQRENLMDNEPYLKFDVTTDDFKIMNPYTKENILNAPIPSISNKRKHLEKQKEQEINDYKLQILELQSQVKSLNAMIEGQKEENIAGNLNKIISSMEEQIKVLQNKCIEIENENIKLKEQSNIPVYEVEVYEAAYVQQLLEKDKLKKENEQLKEKVKPKKEKLFYGGRDLDKYKVPYDIAMYMAGLIPDNILVPEAKFFDPFCRYGELLMAIKGRLMQAPAMKKAYPDEDDRDDYISDNQLYAFVIDKQGLKDVTRIIHKTSNPRKSHVTCFGDEEVYKNIMRSSSSVFIKEKLKEIGQMKFDVVIGNPPYQSSTKSIYNEFIDAAMNMKASVISMIVKNNWMQSDTLKNLRNNMIEYGLKDIINYPVISEVFKNVSTAVSIIMLQRGYSGPTNFLEIQKGNVVSAYNAKLNGAAVIATNINEQTLINKFSALTRKANFGKLTYPSEPFRITSNGKVGRGENTYKLNVHDTKSPEHNIAVIYMESSSKQPYLKYINKSDVPSRVELVSKYKIICGKIVTRDATVINNIRLVKPDTVCTSSWGVIFDSDTEENAKNAYKYIQTKLFRVLVRSLAEDGLIAVSPYRFSLVPLQDFTSNSDIDWSQPLSNIDQQLYKKYNLSEDEITYIEQTIKPLDNSYPTLQNN